jgi:hypothetical protein
MPPVAIANSTAAAQKKELKRITSDIDYQKTIKK